jgi:hypothetical protein
MPGESPRLGYRTPYEAFRNPSAASGCAVHGRREVCWAYWAGRLPHPNRKQFSKICVKLVVRCVDGVLPAAGLATGCAAARQ